MGSSRILAVAALAIVLVPGLAGVTPPVQASLARYADTASTTLAVTTDTLDPPSGLAVTGGTSAALSWTATPDTYATGYDVERAAVSGGPYSIISTVTPRTTVTTTDTPGVGTWYYVLQSYFQSWTSVVSNQAAAIIVGGPTSTGYHGCTSVSNAADTGGHGDGYESSPANACASDGAVATDANTGTNTTISCTDAGKDRHRFWDFGLGVPSAVTLVNGIQVRADVGLNNNAGISQLCVQLSWDGGSSWTTAKSSVVAATGVTTYTLGTAVDTWGRVWSGSDFSNATFRVRLIDASDRINKDFRLDYLAVQVTYTP
jgi:hypothetical protein